MATTPLLQQIRSTAAAALQKGALKPIETTHELLPSTTPTSPPFLLRTLKTRTQKPQPPLTPDPTVAPPTPSNPFLPHDADLHVRDLPPSHKLLLNKYNVASDHVLLVTKSFQAQSALLTHADFRALWQVLAQVDGLAFYNAGARAGASQAHKHLQLIPFPMGPDGASAPLQSAFDRAAAAAQGRFAADVPFLHAGCATGAAAGEAAEGRFEEAGEICMALYAGLLRALEGRAEVAAGVMEGVGGTGGLEDGRPFAYNLLVSRRWMVVVPRACERFEGVSVNALGFVGWLLVRDERGAEVVRGVGGMAVLKHVGFPM